MTNIETKLDRFIAAREAVLESVEKNKAVFDAHQALVMRLMDAENDLRDEAALAEGLKKGEPTVLASQGGYSVTATPVEQTWADIDELDRAIAEGQATNELRARIVKTQQRPTRVSISSPK